MNRIKRFSYHYAISSSWSLDQRMTASLDYLIGTRLSLSWSRNAFNSWNLDIELGRNYNLSSLRSLSLP